MAGFLYSVLVYSFDLRELSRCGLGHFEPSIIRDDFAKERQRLIILFHLVIALGEIIVDLAQP